MQNSAILSTFIKLPFVIKFFVLSIFEWPLKTGFTLLILKGKHMNETFVVELSRKRVHLTRISNYILDRNIMNAKFVIKLSRMSVCYTDILNHTLDRNHTSVIGVVKPTHKPVRQRSGSVVECLTRTEGPWVRASALLVVLLS